MIVWIDNITIHLAPFSDVLHIVDGVGTKNMDRYSTNNTYNISNIFLIGIYNLVVCKISIAVDCELFLNALHIVNGGRISKNNTDNIVKVVRSKLINGIKHMPNLSMDLLPMYSGLNLLLRSLRPPPFPP